MARRIIKAIGGKSILAGLAAALMSSSAMAADMGGLPEEPAPAKDISMTANVTLASEYVFRGFSQTAEHAAIQGGFDLSISWFYIGVWASNLDFGGADTNFDGVPNADVADIEIDWYAGINKSFNGVDMTAGVIYYTYPDAYDPGAELDYVEITAGISGKVFNAFDAGLTVYYSPEYTGETGDVWTIEGNFEVALWDMGPVSTSLSGTLGTSIGDSTGFQTAFGNGDDSYLYWNVGLGFGYSIFTLDLRYWDTDISGTGNFCDGGLFQCDERFVASLTAEFGG